MTSKIFYQLKNDWFLRGVQTYKRGAHSTVKKLIFEITGNMFLALSCLSISSPLISSVLSCLVLSCLVLSCLVLSCLAFALQKSRRTVLHCLVLSCLVLSCLVLFCLRLALQESRRTDTQRHIQDTRQAYQIKHSFSFGITRNLGPMG
jgi:hypothetical protein